MLTILSAFVSLLSFRVRSRASLELELVALRHQMTCPAAATPWSASALLHRPAPLGVALPGLAAGHQRRGAGQTSHRRQWHRKGFRLYWRWRSRRLGRPKMGTEIRNLIRQMSMANPLWGAPRIHGELLKLGIEVSQATVGRYLPWRPRVPSPTWRSFLHNPPDRHCRRRHVRCCNCDIPASLCLDRPRP